MNIWTNISVTNKFTFKKNLEMKIREKLNYFVGRYNRDDSNTLDVYAFGTQLQYGDEKLADNFLQYVKEQAPDKDWQIFWVVTDRDEVK